jgi:hypothetical protein
MADARTTVEAWRNRYNDRRPHGSSVYDHRQVKVRDAPRRELAVRLIVRKRRFFCRPCDSDV